MTNEIVKIVDNDLTQIIMDIDRAFTPDCFKMIYLVLKYCDKNVDIKISNKNHMKNLKLSKPKWCVCRVYKSVSKARNHMFEYKYDREQEKRVKYNWLLKIAYLTWFANLCMSIFLPLTLYHESCLHGIYWLAIFIFLLYLVFLYFLEIFLFLLVTDYYQNPVPKRFSRMSRCGYYSMRLYIIFVTPIESLTCRTVEFATLIFVIECMKCYSDEFNEDYKELLLILLIISLLTFI